MGDVWGIGGRSTRKLAGQGIRTAYDLSRANETWIRKHLSITGVRTMHELQGLSCFPLEETPPPKQSIACSRSFGALASDLQEIREAASSYVSRAAEKLRGQQLKAGCLTLYLTTNRFRTDQPQYANSRTITLPCPTADTAELIEQAGRCLKELFRPGYAYQKVGVVLTDLIPAHIHQGNLFVTRCGVPSASNFDPLHISTRATSSSPLAETGTIFPWPLTGSTTAGARTRSSTPLPG